MRRHTTTTRRTATTTMRTAATTTQRTTATTISHTNCVIILLHITELTTKRDACHRSASMNE